MSRASSLPPIGKPPHSIPEYGGFLIGAGRRFRHPSTQFRPYLFPAYRPLIMSVICFQELPPSLAALAPGVDRPSSMYFFTRGGHLPDPARVFRIVYLVDLLFGIVDHVVELQRGLSVDPVLFAGTVSRVEYQLVLRRSVGEIAGSRRGDQVGPAALPEPSSIGQKLKLSSASSSAIR